MAAEAKRPGTARGGHSGGRGAGAAIRRTALLAAVLLLPGACSLFEDEGPPPPCPPIAAPSDTDHLTRFDGAGRDLTDVLFQARLLSVADSCSYERDDTLIESSLLITFEIERGPALRRLQSRDPSAGASFTYFVAVARNEEEPRILSREAFDVQARFEGNRGRIALADEIAPRIPLGPGEDGRDYRIYVGIELNAAELEYNRQER
ncbi:MAG: hypothetical protein WD100_07455 [Tistlia sp.]|uniref:hypothetical protein n=1 Tax=Tistlia sp. TaxID=3057121 RepID=UPI0034A40286